MSDLFWKENLQRNWHLVNSNAGPSYVIVVSGTEVDCEYWEKRFTLTKSEIFRGNDSTKILSVHESVPKGNFLGTLNAWKIFTGKLAEIDKRELDDVIFMSMVFGKGTRLSPFTQSLGNCKPRFPTPYKSDSNDLYLSIGELSNLYSNLLIGHLAERGFQGLVVKWGDEIVIPGAPWHEEEDDYSNVDAVRFVWFTDPTPELAREKDWVLVDTRTGLMTFQLARQEAPSLLLRVASKRGFEYTRLGVNLGSLAISYVVLNIALDVFSEDLDSRKRVDWDPYVWLALACENQQEWQEEVEYEAQTGRSGLVKLVSQYPDFFQKITRVKDLVEKRKGRPFTVKTLDFGDVFWTDFGQHLALRKNLNALLDDTSRRNLTRKMFNLPHERDRRGNTIVNSKIHPEAKVQNSLIIDSEIRSPDVFIDHGIIVASVHDSVQMPYGGLSLFCTVPELGFIGPNAIAFNSIAPVVLLSKGGRHSTIVSPNGVYQLFSNEAITDYGRDNYQKPILDNAISFAAASSLVDGIDPETLIRLRRRLQNEVLHKQG